MTDADAALSAYNEVRKAHPELFVNPPNTAFEIVLDPERQRIAGAGLIYKDTYIFILRDAVRFRDGSVSQYTRTISSVDPWGAAVLPIVDGKIVLVRHERHATRGKHWEIPRTFAARDEALEKTARREIMEEIGTPDPELVDIGSVHPDTGVSSFHTRLYLARLPKGWRINTDEDIDELKTVTADEFDEMLRNEEITDSFTLAAVLQARVRGLLP